jgi:hypothetical protein
MVMCPIPSLGVNVVVFDVLGSGTMAEEDPFVGVGISFRWSACWFLGGDGASAGQHVSTHGFESCECLVQGGANRQVVSAVAWTCCVCQC